jgi:phosphatidylserine synthase
MLWWIAFFNYADRQAIFSVFPLLVLILIGLRRVWRAPDSSTLWRTLALAALLYPVSLGMRLTLAGSETSQRASEFVFVGVAFLAAPAACMP